MCVAGGQVLGFVVDPDREASAEDEEKLFAIMRVDSLAASTRLEDEELWLEHRRVSGQLLDAHSVTHVRHAALADAHRGAARVLRCMQQVQDRRAVRLGQPLQRGNRRVRLATLDGTDVPRGEAGNYVDGGSRIRFDGNHPLNPHGGQLSEGRLHGHGHILEAVQQLRGNAGARQAKNRNTAILSSVFPESGAAGILVRD